MADAVAFAVFDGNGAPLTGAAGSMSVLAWSVGGSPRTPPVVVELGAGLYQVTPSDSDEAAGTLVLVDTGAGNSPRRLAVACYLPTRANQFWAWTLDDANGDLWAGAAPTFGAFDDATGAPRTPPSIVAVSAGVYLAVPSAGDVAADSAGRIDAPAGAEPAYIAVATEPVVSTGVTPQTPNYPADAVLATCKGVVTLPAPVGGTVTLTSGDNLLLGPPRSTEAGVPQLAVFVLQSGGLAPVPYLGNAESWHVTRVQVTVRSSSHAFHQGEALARALHARAHRATVAGFVYLLAVEADPVFLGIDDDGACRFSFNVDVGSRR